jgi:two-component system, response regulator
MTSQATAILLVEDDPRDARMTVRELQKASIPPHVDVVQDGEEALDYLFCRGVYSERSLDHPPQLILLDLKLPKVDGLQVLREIKSRAETRPIPVVALTSSREEKDMVTCYQLGVNSYIQKPVDFEQFRETIKAIGLYWTKLNEPPPEKMFQAK